MRGWVIRNGCGEKRERAAARKLMEFKNLKTDVLTLTANLVKREAGDRSPALAAALRTIERVEEGRYGAGRPDVRMCLAIGPGLEAHIEEGSVDDDSPLSDVVDTVEQLVDAAERIFDDRDAMVAMVREVRAAPSKECSKGRRRGLPYRTLDVSLTRFVASAGGQSAAEVTIEVVGSLQPLERLVFVAESAEDVVAVFADMREELERLLAMRSDLARLGADVAIDAVTLAALEDAGIVPAKAIDDMRHGQIIDIDVRHGRLVLYVDKGVITGNVPLGDGMRWQDGRLTVPKARGISLKNISGKRLDRLVPHDFFEPGLTVSHGSEVGDSLWLRVPTRPVGLSLTEEKKAA